MPISTDSQLIDQVLDRGVENIYPSRDFVKARLQEGKKLTLYVGYDPTAPTLHVGHAITLLKLRHFQLLGHKVIMLIGDFTGMIGDPTDKTSARKRLTHKETLKNAKVYQEQAAHILDFIGKNKAELKYNGEWLHEMSFADVIELASHFTVQRMLERDMFDNRMKEGKPIYLHEFMYPLMQGYDSVKIVKGGIDGEVGGNDQTFNMLAGRTLMKALCNGKEKFVITMKLLTDNSGAKMGKTTGNMLAFTDTPEDAYGKVMSWSDGLIVPGFELCTLEPMDALKQIEKGLKKGENPRDYKRQLAYTIVRDYYSEAAAQMAQEHFDKVFSAGENPDDMPEVSVGAKTMNIVELLVAATLVKSKSEARRAIEQGGVSVDEKKITDITEEITLGKGIVLRKGKRHFARVKP